MSERDAGNEPQEMRRTHLGMIWGSKMPRQDDTTRRMDSGGTWIERAAQDEPPRERNTKKRDGKKDETRKRDEGTRRSTRRIRTIRASNERRPDRKDETPHETHKRDGGTRRPRASDDDEREIAFRAIFLSSYENEAEDG